MIRRKKKESVIPAFWLEDDPAPPDLWQRMKQAQQSPESSARPQPQDVGRGRVGQQRQRTAQLSEANRQRAVHRGISGTVSPSSRRQTAGRDGATISLQLHLPSIDLSRIRRALQLSRKTRIIGSVIIMAAVTVGVGVKTFQVLSNRRDGKPTVGQAVKPELRFKPLVPAKSGEGTAANMHYDAQRKMVSYSDSYAGASVTVSQQELPEKFKNDESAFKELVKSFGAADQKFDAGIGDLYLAGYDKTEFGILKTEKFLLFLRADKQLGGEAWRDYIATLKVGT